MKIKVVSVPVLDQQKALDFYTDLLGFEKKVDIPVGGGNRWLTVVSKKDPNGPELLLEPAPNHFEPSKVYQEALMEAGIPCMQLYVDDIQAEYDRLSSSGVEFSVKPSEMGPVMVAIFHDTCGNLIQLIEEK
ncbi:VOC family protein [Pontibacter sp. G13]|uniref:VOC family protein n=1 Tax=Pontibacter sp. G13 TaxID=3074898 RepID=UPI00288A0103|nr:VOC family protein [Pontibacter sp. G13]WNJ17880.1 VOC family protein [Pontibacter sp. G13]